MIPTNPEKSLKLAIAGKIPNLQQFTARRLVSGDLSEVSNKERAAINAKQWRTNIRRIAPDFNVRNVGEGGVVLLSSFRNEKAVQTHAKDRNTPCEIFRWIDIPKGKFTHLKIRASYHPHGDWKIRVKAEGKVLAEQVVSYEAVKDEWLNLDIDLSQYAGKNIKLTIENAFNDGKNAYAFWGPIKVVQE